MLALNLIPSQLKAEQQDASKLKHWLRAGSVFALFIIVGTVGLVSIWQLMLRHQHNVQVELSALQRQQGVDTGTDIATTTSKLNSTIQTLTTTVGSPQSWPELTHQVLNILPVGVTVAEFTMSPNGAFHIIGVADSRQTFITLEQLLKNDPHLKNVTTASSASKRTDVPFDFSGTVISTTASP